MADARKLPQGAARRASPGLTPLRWQRSQKLAGYYDSERHALIYQDASGREVDRVELPAVRSSPLHGVVE
jgi:hypothetical protein